MIYDNRLPVLISIPHSGLRVPSVIKNIVNISDDRIKHDIDLYSDVIYNLKEHALSTVKHEYARTIVDVNRPSDDLPPDNPDGVIKTHSCTMEKIYKNGRFPSKYLVNALLEECYFPFHQALSKAIEKNKNKLLVGLDCHTMSEKGPAISRDKGSRRPLICISNRENTTSSSEMLGNLKQALSEGFGIKPADIKLNSPFKGGYITSFYGNRTLPYIQIELNRSLFLKKCPETGLMIKADVSDLAHLNYCFLKSLCRFCSMYTASENIYCSGEIPCN